MNRSLTTALLYQIIIAILLYLLLLFLLPTRLYAQTDIRIGTGAQPASRDRTEEPGEQYTNQLYLPQVINSKPSESTCQLSAEEEAMAQLLTTSPDQQRPTLVCNAALTAIARSRAEDMAHRSYFAHINPDGYGPNYIAQQTGYVLPSFYDQSPTGNNIESIGGGTNSAEAMWDAWMNSEKHSTHLLGTNPFFKDQSEYGIGFIQSDDSQYKFYWVILSAQPG